VKEKRTTLDGLDRALLQPISKEGLAVDSSTHFTRSKSVLGVRKTMTEATIAASTLDFKNNNPGPMSWLGLTTKDASIPQEKRTHTSGNYNFNVAKSMKSGTRKNPEEEAHKELKLGALDVWALGNKSLIFFNSPPSNNIPSNLSLNL